MMRMRMGLPASFRINSTCPYADFLQSNLQQFMGKKLQVEVNGVATEVGAVTQLPWYPGGIAYQLGCERRVIRKSPELKDFHQWFMAHTDSGDITRQEAVSMIPPLFLDVQPGMSVLDSCAAPGSKTVQLLEMCSRGEEGGGPNGGSDSIANFEGVVVANDVNRDRAYMLHHQAKRIASPALMVTHCAAQRMPNLGPKPARVGAGAVGDAAAPSPTTDRGVFDRSLADVPCSGDGTLRKSPNIWGSWATQTGHSLHQLQLQIACRAAALTKVGGFMVYSTCSLNPIENEAVVAELLRRAGGSLELVDSSERFPQLKRRKGMSSWHVLTDHGTVRWFGKVNKIDKDEARAQKVAADKAAGLAVQAAGKAAEAAAVAAVVADSEEGDKGGKALTPVGGATEAAGGGGGGGGGGEGGGGAEASMEEGGDGGGAAAATAATAATAVTAASTNGGNTETTPPRQMLSNDDEVPFHENPLEHAKSLGFTRYASHEEVTGVQRKVIKASSFPPSAEEAKWMRLERCMRFMPNDQDTGGFFVCLLKKTGPIVSGDGTGGKPGDQPQKKVEKKKEEEEEEEEGAEVVVAEAAGGEGAAEGVAAGGESPKKKKMKTDGSEEKDLEGSEEKCKAKDEEEKDKEGIEGPYYKDLFYVPMPEEEAKRLCGMFGIAVAGSDSTTAGTSSSESSSQEAVTKALDIGRLYQRGKGSKVIYWMTEVMKTLYHDCEPHPNLPIVTCGMKVFEKNYSKQGAGGVGTDAEYRFCQDGTKILEPYVTRRKAFLDARSFSVACAGNTVPISSFNEEAAAALLPLGAGGALLIHEVEAGPHKGRKLRMSVWRCKQPLVNVLVDKATLAALRTELKALGIYVEPPPPVVKEAEGKANMEGGEAAAAPAAVTVGDAVAGGGD